MYSCDQISSGEFSVPRSWAVTGVMTDTGARTDRKNGINTTAKRVFRRRFDLRSLTLDALVMT